MRRKMNKQTIDILLKMAFLIGCVGLGLGASNLINRYYAEQEAKSEVFDQFVDICLRTGGTEEVWW